MAKNLLEKIKENTLRMKELNDRLEKQVEHLQLISAEIKCNMEDIKNRKLGKKKILN